MWLSSLLKVWAMYWKEMHFNTYSSLKWERFWRGSFVSKIWNCAAFWKNELLVLVSNDIEMFIYLSFADILKPERNKAALYVISDHFFLSLEKEKGKATYVGTTVFSLNNKQTWNWKDMLPIPNCSHSDLLGVACISWIHIFEEMCLMTWRDVAHGSQT